MRSRAYESARFRALRADARLLYLIFKFCLRYARACDIIFSAVSRLMPSAALFRKIIQYKENSYEQDDDKRC